MAPAFLMQDVAAQSLVVAAFGDGATNYDANTNTVHVDKNSNQPVTEFNEAVEANKNTIEAKLKSEQNADGEQKTYTREELEAMSDADIYALDAERTQAYANQNATSEKGAAYVTEEAAKNRTSKAVAMEHILNLQTEGAVQSNAVTQPVTQPFTKDKLSVTDIDKMLRNQTAFTEEQIGNMYGLQLETVLENFLSQIKGNTKVNADFRATVQDAIAQGDADVMKTLVSENQEKFLMREDLADMLVVAEDESTDIGLDEGGTEELQNMQEDATLQTETEDGIYFEDEKWDGKTELDYQPSSGARLVATSGKTTTIIGTFEKDIKMILQELKVKKSKNFGAKINGFNLLNVPDADYQTYIAVFWEKFNKIWLDEAIKRGDVILLATEPRDKYLYSYDEITGEAYLTGFGKEYYYLTQECGYQYDIKTKSMIPKK